MFLAVAQTFAVFESRRVDAYILKVIFLFISLFCIDNEAWSKQYSPQQR